MLKRKKKDSCAHARIREKKKKRHFVETQKASELAPRAVKIMKTRLSKRNYIEECTKWLVH